MLATQGPDLSPDWAENTKHDRCRRHDGRAVVPTHGTKGRVTAEDRGGP